MAAPRNPEITLGYSYDSEWTNGLTNEEITDVRHKVQGRIKAEYLDLIFSLTPRGDLGDYDLNVVLSQAADFVNGHLAQARNGTDLMVEVAGATKICIYNVRTGEHSNTYTFPLLDGDGSHALPVLTETGKSVQVPMTVMFGSDCVFD